MDEERMKKFRERDRCTTRVLHREERLYYLWKEKLAVFAIFVCQGGVWS